MNPDAAQKLTVKLANKLALPDTADALAPLRLPRPRLRRPGTPAARAGQGRSGGPGSRPPTAQKWRLGLLFQGLPRVNAAPP